MMQSAVKKRSAFSFIELMVSVGIIAILATASLIILTRVRRQARDTARVNDITQLQSALAAYRRDQGAYPSIITGGQALVVSSTIYMSKVPTYVQPVDTGCPATSTYSYGRPAANSYYINFCLSSDIGDLSAGNNSATPEGFLRP